MKTVHIEIYAVRLESVERPFGQVDTALAATHFFCRVEKRQHTRDSIASTAGNKTKAGKNIHATRDLHLSS